MAARCGWLSGTRVVKRLLMAIELVVTMLAAENDAVGGFSSVLFSRIPAEFDGERTPGPAKSAVVPASVSNPICTNAAAVAMLLSPSPSPEKPRWLVAL